MTSWFQLRHCSSFSGLDPFWRQGLDPSLTRELSEFLSVFNDNATGLPVFPRNAATYPGRAPECKYARFQFLYFHPVIFVPFLHHIKEFLMTTILHISPAICTSIFLLTGFVASNSHHSQQMVKSSTQSHSDSFTGTVSANSHQSSPMSIGCSPRTFQTLQLFWEVLTPKKNWASYWNHLGVLGLNIIYSNFYA